MSELSGPQWCARYPTSHRIQDLAPGFQACVLPFHAALVEAGANISIGATLRPKERGFLMHSAWRIVRENASPKAIPAFPGVDIDWTHGGNLAAARKAALSMVIGFDLAFKPSLGSRHYDGRAIDWTISWIGTLNIRNRAGTLLSLKQAPRDGQNRDLWAVGAGYGVHKLPSDPPHWSDDGR